MRIWDIDPGYLNRQSLLGEHRELHAIVSIIGNNKTGYSKHPETLRWVDHGWAISRRHSRLAAEMELRGYTDRSPVGNNENEGNWPEIYIDDPVEQLEILKKKYIGKEAGRIPFPRNAQELWAHHKYSVMARDVKLYEKIGKSVSGRRSGDDFSELAKLLVETLRIKQDEGGMRNALQHMWGYVSGKGEDKAPGVESWSNAELLNEIQIRAKDQNEPYLMSSTALSELKVWT